MAIIHDYNGYLTLNLYTMSVLVADIEVFERIYTKIDSFKYNGTVDINYSYMLGQFRTIDSKKFVTNLLHLNELSFIKRYREDSKPDLHELLKLEHTSTPRISTLQLYKYLQCISYNIEIETIKTGYDGTETNVLAEDLQETYNLLEKVINDLSGTIISQIAEYTDLKYCDV